MLPLFSIHGPGHWLRVLQNGRALAALTPGADTELIDLFAMLHDSERRDEDGDRGHGERAATSLWVLKIEGLLRVGSQRQKTLADACAGHELGGVTVDLTIGCCWDADRLELARLGRRPVAHFLSTTAALDPGIQAGAWQRGRTQVVDGDLAEAWALDPNSIKAQVA